MFVVDSHSDTPSQIIRLRDLSIDNVRGHVDFPKLHKGGVDASFFSMYIPARLNGKDAYAYALRLLSAVQETVARCSDSVAFATTAREAYENKRKGLVSIFLALENASPIGRDLKRLKYFYDNGVRYVTLCHSADNEVCDSVSQGSTHHGLSAFGRDFVAYMNELGMIVDCAHASDESFYDILDCSKGPVASTHSACRALVPHKRNMSDDMIRALARHGGVIQVAFYPEFIDSSFAAVLRDAGLDNNEEVEYEFIKDPSNPVTREAWYKVEDRIIALPRPSYRRVVDHIEHIISLVGAEHVGVGSDFDGITITPQGLENVSKFQCIFEEMRRRGHDESVVAKVAGENFLRLLQNF